MVRTLARRRSRILVIVGLFAMLVGVLDPLEGSFVILAGVGLVAFAALRGTSKYRRLLLWSFVLVAAGVGAMVGLSALGGVGGTSGRSHWWALAILPYPVGWIMGLVGAVQSLREASPPSARLG
jgi:hypothetical protein